MNTENRSEDLRYWLANEDWDMSRFTRRWLERTPPGEAADTLAEIAEGARPEPGSLLYRLVLVVALSGFANSVAGVAERKAGIRAALLLANLGDDRCVAPLVRVFDPYGFWQSRYEAQIERALTRFLAAAADGGGDAGRHAADVRLLVERAWRGGRGGDLRGSIAELLLAAVHYLRVARGAEGDDALLRGIAGASLPNPEHQPNRARVRDAAFAALDPVAVA